MSSVRGYSDVFPIHAHLYRVLSACRVGANKWASVPQGVQSLLLQRVGGGGDGKPAGLLLVYSERPRCCVGVEAAVTHAGDCCWCARRGPGADRDLTGR